MVRRCKRRDNEGEVTWIRTHTIIRTPLFLPHVVQVQIMHSFIHEFSHLLAIVRQGQTMLLAQEQVGYLIPLAVDDGSEDTVQVLPVLGFQRGGYPTVEQDESGGTEAGVVLD